MRKKWVFGLVLLLLLSACTQPQGDTQAPEEQTRYTGTFYDTFDTVVQLVAYTETEEEFNTYLQILKEQFTALHQDFDKYHAYEGVNNVYTINENAGVAPVTVNPSIIDLIERTKERYETISAKTDISNGALYEVWHLYREDTENPQVPSDEELQAAAAHSGMEHIIVDKAAGTVYIDDKDIRLDLGAVAKGYATEMGAQALKEAGLTAGIINSGGNVRTIGKPADERDRWGIGIQNPDYLMGKSSEENAEVVFVADQSVVTSGDYQRFYTVDGQVYHHLIDPDTRYPADRFRAVSIVTEDSGLADFLSTAVFLLEYEEGRALVESIEGTEALWILKDGSLQYTAGMEDMSYSKGADATD